GFSKAALVSTGGLFVQPEMVREGSNGQLYVADYSASNTGAIIGALPRREQGMPFSALIRDVSVIDGPADLPLLPGPRLLRANRTATGPSGCQEPLPVRSSRCPFGAQPCSWRRGSPPGTG